MKKYTDRAVSDATTTAELLESRWAAIGRKTEGANPPDAQALIAAINGPSAILGTVAGRMATKAFEDVVQPNERERSTGKVFRIHEGEIFYTGLNIVVVHNISIAFQAENENTIRIVSPVRLLLLAYIEAGLHDRKVVPASESRIEIGRHHAVTRIPKFTDIASNIHLRDDINAATTPDGVSVSEMMDAERKMQWSGKRPMVGTIDFYPRTIHMVNYETGESVAANKEVMLHPNDFVTQSMMDTFAGKDARGTWLGDGERIGHLAMSLQDHTAIPIDLVLHYLIKPGPRNFNRFAKFNKDRAVRALNLARVMHIKVGSWKCPAWIIDVDYHGQDERDMPVYRLARARWLQEIMSPKTVGNDASAVRLTGALFRRFDSAGASPLIPRFYAAAEQILSYSGGLLPVKKHRSTGDKKTKTILMSEALHPDNKDWWASFNVEQWAKICGIKYDGCIPKNKNPVYSKLFQIRNRIFETQNNHPATIQFRKPNARNFFIEFQATPMYREAHLLPKRSLMQVATLGELIKRIEDYD